MIKEALLYERLENNRVKCRACARYCNIPEGKIGFCGIRRNIDGKLYLLVYGKVIATHIDPIEKKPVIHYMPGSRIFSIGTTGCSWLCHYCQNYDISQRRKVEGIDMSPEEVVSLAEAYRCQGIAYTYNEPTIFIEFAHDAGVMARSKGLINIFVSNGYCTSDSVNMMNDFLDCITVDFKGNGETNFLRRYVGIPDAKPIFQTLLEIRDKTKIHIEITDLVVPQIGDNIDEARKLSEWIYENLGPDIPIHFLRFRPDYKLMHLPSTPIETLKKHYKVARETGLNYVYIGNVPGNKLENTYCPQCDKMVVKRFGFDITGWYLDDNNRCMDCGHKIPIVGKLNRSILESIR
ncbi:MAG: AmmeMemoRadiSam system radical SAM enzyme [archaeon]|nr:AmmeMemoRadiSam system radical SAM enzyme [archaeon]MCP8312810.1 AmmeMemoRadiSam system radical SAM enzyme [archaeon]MCP8317039.1 AmmeMemoRadiSam system radical SAM enzyme [archaeon]MCP8321250.1 AmmeMemoRadiSam system radical SAM enzyme [archaeon]